LTSYKNILIYIFAIVTYCFLYPIVYNLSHAHNVHRIRIVPISSFLEAFDHDNFTRRFFVQSVRLSIFSSTRSLQHSICTATSKDTPVRFGSVRTGVSKDFVSINILHDVDAKILELQQEDYWEKAVERFKEYLGPNGPKERLVPLSPADEKLLVELTDKEILAAQHLPFASVLGVVQYPTCYTKLEIKYSMSVLSRWRTKWSTKHFEILIKALEYGYSSRKMGLKYDGNGDTSVVNVLVGLTDAALSVPRSQGSRSIMMNRAAITMTSKRHSTIDDSTLSSEITEAYLLACEIEGFRNLMAEVGLEQNGPTILYQDKMAAIQVAMNRGSLRRKTRGTELRVLTHIGTKWRISRLYQFT
jgi:hypothetical protein